MANQQNTAREDAITAIRFPVRLLTAALVLTTVAFAWFGWSIFDERRDAKMFQDESLRTEELRGVIVHLDEVLTMSARIAAATGDPKWEERYRRFEPQLDAAIKETTKLGTTRHDIKAASKTDEANIKLVEMENRAFGLVRAGRKEEAQAVVFSPEYEAQKKIYAEGIESFNSQIRREVDEHARQDTRIDFLLMIGALVVLAISCAAWLSVVRGLQRWRAVLEQACCEREQAEQNLRRAHDELETRIEQRTVELARTNEALQVENAQRKKAERQLSIEYAISRILSESTALEQAAPKVLQAICETLNWDVGVLWIVDHRAEVLRCNEIWSAPDIHFDEFKTPSRQKTFARGLGLPGRVWASGQSAWIRDVTQDKDFRRAAAAKQVGLHGAFAFPILIGNEVGGVIECFSREARESDDSLLRTGTNLGGQLGLFFERRRVEEHLFQSQKMETVGRLAGGIAHEFNSILTAIIGQSELLLDDLPDGSPLVRNATEISKAAERAATLTRQLLAYGRKQILQPEILDLNSVLAGMESTLRHLMGRGTDVRLAPATGLKAVKADAGQIEHVIMQMAMNAADAMPNGGKLTLETANVTLDQEYVSRLPDLKAGEYVMLAITDTGAGMSEEAKARVFEPFFSTKGVGQGTGLGLSTCYGIIKQSGGHISVYSELARGATFKVYLPQVEQPVKLSSQHPAPPDLPRGTEAILLVEDDPALREMAATLLRRLGYTVLAAANGIEALNLQQQRDIGHFDLLFTDVVMPHMSGKELSERVQSLYPHTKILFTSAYTENAIVHQGVLTKGVVLLQKPFTPSALAHKVREILDNGKA